MATLASPNTGDEKRILSFRDLIGKYTYKKQSGMACDDPRKLDVRQQNRPTDGTSNKNLVVSVQNQSINKKKMSIEQLASFHAFCLDLHSTVTFTSQLINLVLLFLLANFG